MQHWSRKKGMMGDDPPYLAVGTEVSAKYKGAFCEAKVRKVVKSVKCKVTFKLGLGTAIITDDQIRGTLRVGSLCEVKHPEKKEFVEATINKIQDCSQYTVVFDDGDITTLRRTALCLKSGRHFAESETLDQLPLTHPEHFGNPVIGGRKGRRSRQTHDESSDDEGAPKKGKRKEEKEADIGKVVCVELGDKKKQKDNWFPGLVVAPTAQDTVRIRVRDEYLVRSFKDGRYFTVPKKEATEFTREIGAKVDNNTLRTAVEKALLYLDRDELPPHWDRDLLFGMDESSGNSDSDGGFDSDSSDDEPREEKDHFVAQLYKFMDDRGTPINKGPTIGNRDVDLYKLFKVVHKLGGYNRVTNQNQWKIISHKLGFGQGSSSIVNLVKQAYKKFLHSFEDFYRKLGCTMVNHPRGNRSRHRSGRSLIRDRDRATPINPVKDKEKTTAAAAAASTSAATSTSAAATPSSEKASEVPEKEKNTTSAEKKVDTEKPKENEKKDRVEESSKSKDQKKEKQKQKEEKPDSISKEEKKSEKSKVKGDEISTEKSKTKEEKLKVTDVPKADTEEKERLRVRETRKDDRGKECRSRGTIENDNTCSSTNKIESKNNEETARLRQAQNTVAPSVARLAVGESTSEDKVKPKEEKVKIKEVKQKLKDSKTKKEEKLKSIVERGRPREEKSEVKQKDEKTKEERTKLVAVAAALSPVTATKTAGAATKTTVTKTVAASTPPPPPPPAPPPPPPPPPTPPLLPVVTATTTMTATTTCTVTSSTTTIATSTEEDKTEKTEDCKRKAEKKVEDEEKQTRSKSKEDLRQKKDTAIPERRPSESRTPVREPEKRIPPRPKKGEDEMTLILKKRGRKRKETDEKSKSEENLGQLANYITVGVGDKLKVYYGPTHESKVTYEAKVLDVEEDGNESVYLVHYTGWNTRYDEWIKRGRIADNLSWTPSRAKRLRHQQAQTQLKTAKPVLGKRGRPSLSSRSQDVPNTQQPPRSTTPSSVTSSSSRTKSPATTASRSSGCSRITRNTSDSSNTVPGSEFRRRTRRMSGYTDISLASESESEEYESEAEVEPTQTRSKTEKRTSVVEKEETSKDESHKEETKKLERPFRRKNIKRKEDEDEEDKESLREDDIVDLTPEVDTPAEVQNLEKRRSKRTKKTPVATPVEKKDDDTKVDTPVKQEPATENEEEQPKGRDFDLNQIRSELKGIEKAVKLPHDVGHRTEEKCSQLVLDDKTGLIDIKPKVEEEEVQIKIPEEKVQEKPVDTSTEDIYEFKEPEPFEFEVRSKRDLSEERASKLNRRPRIFDDVIEPKVERSPRKKLIRSVTTTKTEDKEELPFEGEVKKRFRRSIVKKADVPVPEIKRKDAELVEELQLPSSKVIQVEPVTPQKPRPLSACEEAFDKLCESPSFHVATKPSENRTPSPAPKSIKSPDLEPLSLFSELPGEGPDDEVEDDSEDRLVISETDETETETEEPLFSYPQHHHEEIFPTLSSSESATPSSETAMVIDRLAPSKPSPEPPQLLPMAANMFTNFTSGDDLSGKNEEVVQSNPVNDESEKMIEQPVGVQMDDDVMKLLLKGDDDEFEDDPINAAIQRVIEQAITDEESNDMDLFGSKSVESLPQETTIMPKPESLPVEESRKETPLKETGKRKSGGRKPVLSKEFVDDTDSDSDSSDEEERLVIAKDDDDNTSSSSSQCSLKLHVSESSDFEMKLRLSDRDEDSKTEGEESENKSEVNNSTKEVSLGVTTVNENGDAKDDKLVMQTETNHNVDESENTTTVNVEVEDTTVAEDVEHIERNTDGAVVESKPSVNEESVTVLKSDVVEEDNVEKIVPTTQTLLEKPDENVESEKCEEEVESNLRSLLCEETIPGSPAPVIDATQVTEACHEEHIDGKTLILEMPFASAPGSNCTPSSSSSAVSGKSSAPPIFVSPSIVEPPATTAMTVDLSSSVQVQPVVTSTTSTVSSPSPSTPQVQVQSPPVSSSVSVAGPSPELVHQGPGPGMSKRNSNEAAPVMDNTPPTTPDSSLSTISGSPREERDGMSPTIDNESSKSHRDSFEIDLDSCAEGNKVDHYSEEDSLLNIEVSNSSENRLQSLKLLPKKSSSDLEKELDSSPKKRRRSRKRSDCESNKRSRHSSGRSPRSMGGVGSGGGGVGAGGGGGGCSDSDTSENSTAGGCTPLTSSENILSSRSPRPSKYNFYVELDPELDGTQRIALLQQKLQELRKTYINVKAELACIDRRRKKLRRREREEKATKQEVVCS